MKTFFSGATYTIQRSGQCDPDQSDKVEVQATLQLPINANNSHLRDDLRFGDRCEIARNPLRWDWGVTSNCRKWRVSTQVFFAETWTEAEQEATTWAESELMKLDRALMVRASWLRAAEFPPEHRRPVYHDGKPPETPTTLEIDVPSGTERVLLKLP